MNAWVFWCVSCWKIFVRCPYCKCRHSHGGGDGYRPVLGSRSAHCGLGEYTISIDSYNNASVNPLACQPALLASSNQLIVAENGAE